MNIESIHIRKGELIIKASLIPVVNDVERNVHGSWKDVSEWIEHKFGYCYLVASKCEKENGTFLRFHGAFILKRFKW